MFCVRQEINFNIILTASPQRVKKRRVTAIFYPSQPQWPSTSVFSATDYERSRYVGVTYQNTQHHIPEDRNFDTAREPLISHTNSVLSKRQPHLRCHWDQHLCHYRHLQTTMELTRWIIYVGNRLTPEVALQVLIVYFFYFVSMIHKMAASYTRNVFKVNEFPLVISAAPIISLYKTMCSATTQVMKLAYPLQQRVLFNQSLNFIYWETPITTMNISCNSIT